MFRLERFRNVSCLDNLIKSGVHLIDQTRKTPEKEDGCMGHIVSPRVVHINQFTIECLSTRPKCCLPMGLCSLLLFRNGWTQCQESFSSLGPPRGVVFDGSTSLRTVSISWFRPFVVPSVLGWGERKTEDQTDTHGNRFGSPSVDRPSGHYVWSLSVKGTCLSSRLFLSRLLWFLLTLWMGGGQNHF